MNKNLLENIFDIKTGKDLSYALLPKGKIPVISHTGSNLGVVCFTKNLEGYELIPNNTLSLGHIGSWNCFYRNEPYYLGTRTKALFPKENMSKIELLVYSMIINQESYKYHYGRVAGIRINKTLIPTLKEVQEIIKNNNLTIDILEQSKIEDFKLPFHILKEKIELKPKEWIKYNVVDLFNISKGKRLIEKDRIKGNIKYFSASKENNGVSDKIGNPLFTNKNAIIYTTFGDCFFGEGEFSGSDEITMLNHEKLNKYNSMFLISLFNKNKYKYAFGRKAFYNKIITENIKLPSKINIDTDKYEPDWQYMEDYIKSLPYSKNI